MSCNTCNASALAALISSTSGSSSNARSEGRTLADLAREARSMAVSDNAKRASFATATSGALGIGAADGSSSAGSNATKPAAGIGAAGTVGRATSMVGVLLEGIRNRLLLKYAGIDYEFYNPHDTKYRTAAS